MCSCISLGRGGKIAIKRCIIQFSSIVQSCPTLCTSMDCSTPGFPVHHQFLELAQTHVHQVGDAIQPSHPLSSPFPPTPNPSQHQSLFQWVNSLHEVAKPRQHIKKQRHYFANKGPSSQSYGFSSSHVWMWELDYEESWAPKNWCLWTVVLEKTLERPLDCKEIQPVHPKGNQPWIFIGRTDAEAETSVIWPPHVKNRLIGKDPDAGKEWRQEEKGMTEDEIFGWHHWHDGHDFQ